jgi:porin
MFQQMVYRVEDYSSQKGLTAWGEVAISPKPSVSSIPYFLGGGLSYQGLISNRGKDIASLGAIYGSFSGYIPQTSGEAVVEANYLITLTPWLSITPDLQYVIKPGGSSTFRDAVVLGAQLAVTF